MENGSDLRSRVGILEQRATTVSESLQELVKIIRGISWELNGILGELNAKLLREREEEGRLDLDTFLKLDRRLALLDEALKKLGKP